MRRLALAAALAALVATPAFAPASAEVKASAPDSFTLAFRGAIPLPREEAWARVINPSSWWSDAHTYSGEASNITLDATPGGCWCEAWENGQVQHGRVLTLMNGSLLRLDAPFGPLQELGLSTAFTIALADGADDGSTEVTFTYRANGSSSSGLDAMAAPVDQVIGEQFGRLLKPATAAQN